MESVFVIKNKRYLEDSICKNSNLSNGNSPIIEFQAFTISSILALGMCFEKEFMNCSSSIFPFSNKSLYANKSSFGPSNPNFLNSSMECSLFRLIKTSPKSKIIALIIIVKKFKLVVFYVFCLKISIY